MIHAEDQILLLERFNNLENDFLSTVIINGAEPVGDNKGIIQGKGGVELREVQSKSRILLQGLVQVNYPAKGNINPIAGELNLEAGINFDSRGIEKEEEILWREQYFLTLTGKGQERLWLYFSIPDQLCFQIQSPSGKIILDKRMTVNWRKEELHPIRIRWGNSLEIFLDQVQVANEAWSGLWNGEKVNLEESLLYLGSNISARGTESNLQVSEFSIRTPKSPH